MARLHTWLVSVLRGLLSAALLAAVLALAWAAMVQAQGTGTLEGTVVNGTAGGPPVGAGLAVTLHVLQGDSEVKALQTTTDANGTFRYEGLDTNVNLEYSPEVVYLGVPYSSAEPVRFAAGQTALAVTVTVYETTADDSAIRLDSVHMIAESFGQMLRISEIHLLGNSGDRTYIGSGSAGNKPATVFIPLPENAVGLAFGADTPPDRFVEVEGGLMDTQPVPPGNETSLAFFSYHLPVSDDRVPVERSFAYPVTTLNVLVAQPGLDLKSEQLASMGQESFQGRQYGFYGAQDLAPDAPLGMEYVLVAEPATGQVVAAAPPEAASAGNATPKGNQALLRWIGFGLVALAMVGAVVYSLVTRQSVPAAASGPDLAADPKARRLLADLCDLEEAFAAGQVDEGVYERRRAELYGALKSL